MLANVPYLGQTCHPEKLPSDSDQNCGAATHPPHLPNAPKMIQLKVRTTASANTLDTDSGHSDITQLHRQLRRLSRRVCQRPEEEAGRDNRSVPGTRLALDGFRE